MINLKLKGTLKSKYFEQNVTGAVMIKPKLFELNIVI